MKLIFVLFTFIIFFYSLQGQSIKNLLLKSIDDKRFEMKECLNKGLIIISFWSTWCSSCQEKLKI